MEWIQTFKGSWPWPWPWIRPYGISSYITHRPLYLYTKFHSNRRNFLWTDGRTDVRTDGHFSPLILLGRLLEVDLKSAHRRRKRCALGVVRRNQKNFAPPQTPFPGARDSQNLISWRCSLPLPTNSVWWESMNAISSYRGNRPTNTHTQTDRGDYNTLHHSFASAQCNKRVLRSCLNLLVSVVSLMLWGREFSRTSVTEASFAKLQLRTVFDVNYSSILQTLHHWYTYSFYTAR